jgi:ABC-type spermidine/putrescine transport system permease subunit II
LFYLAFWSAAPGAPGHFTLQWFHDAFTAPGFGHVLLNTAVFALVKAALAAAIGAQFGTIRGSCQADTHPGGFLSSAQVSAA